LAFPLDFDYLHVTRYGDVTHGGQLRWIVEPRAPVAGRVVLVLDDILDEGVTLAAIAERLLAQGASRGAVRRVCRQEPWSGQADRRRFRRRATA
jgi:hypoxanthine phosphoribosyltransferase